MKHGKVGALMTSDVVRAEYGTPFKEVARLLAEHRISGLPVVDDDEKVLGVISETDLMARQADAPGPPEPHHRFHRPGWTPLGWTPGSRARRTKARARTAGQLMSSPAITVHSDATVAEAARVMARRRVERLPVVDDEERLVGIVTRRDLLQVFLRPDPEIRSSIRDDVLVRALWLTPYSVDVDVHEGVVTLTGQLERRSECATAVEMCRRTDGVVAVVDHLTHRFDDSWRRPDDPAPQGITGNWLRNL
ncbi:CBS domain-containing protein [Streptomyces sp. NPDC101116]|uniref:CBS domain-containing protein n=1 Tax=Streptomyces sp. NPDC101116 TaxID=3366107 RepID=UPI0037F31B90